MVMPHGGAALSAAMKSSLVFLQLLLSILMEFHRIEQVHGLTQSNKGKP